MGGRKSLYINELTQKDITKFWSKVQKTDNCWIWKGQIYGTYGIFRVNGIYHQATAISFLLVNGYVTDNLCRCHTCDNRICINPLHLWEGTHKANMQDMMQKGRGKNQFSISNPSSHQFKQGHIPASRNLSEQKARAIKTDLKTMRQCDVIRKHKVSRDTVRGIVRGTAWGSI